MGLACSTQKSSKKMKNSQKLKSKVSNGYVQKPKMTNKPKTDPSAKEINIEDGLTFFLQRLDKLNQQQCQKKHSNIGTLFEKQKQILEWKLDCDIVFIIDLTMNKNHKRLKLLKELLSEKERHQSKFGIVYFSHNKTQFDLIDESEETTYDIQKQLQKMKLNDWISIIKSLREQINKNENNQLPQIYILSEQITNRIDESILEIVDSLLENTQQQNSLAFECHSFKVEDEDQDKSFYMSNNVMQFDDQIQ